MTVLTKKLVCGKRKTAIARISLKEGTGKITVNGREAPQYFHKRAALLHQLNMPFITTGSENRYDTVANIQGGGLSGQAGALRHAIAKSLNLIVPSYHKTLKDAKLLTRDPRKVQRKLYGHKKARKSFQFSKR